MRHETTDWAPLLTSSLLALVGSGCDLDPKSVGDESTSTATSSVGSTDTGAADDTASTTNGDPAGEGEPAGWTHGHYRRLVRTAGGLVLALAYDDDDVSSTITSYYPDGTEVQSSQWVGRSFEGFDVKLDGNLVTSGWQSHDDDPLAFDAYLWLWGEDFTAEQQIVVGGSSIVTDVAVAGATMWTLTAQSEALDQLRLGVLRRHGADGTTQLTHPLLAPSSTLAVDTDGFAYSIDDDDSPELHRVAPEGGVVWSLPLDVNLSGSRVLHPRPGQVGVVIVSSVAGGRHVQELDGDGATLHEFFVPAMASPVPPAADVGTAILLAHPLPPNAYVVESRSTDGTLLWSATRTVTDATEIQVVDVLETPTGAAVIGNVMGDTPGPGFIRFITP